METKIFYSKVDWWVYALIPFVVFCCMLGPILSNSDYWLGVLLSAPLCILMFWLLSSTRYAVRGKALGVKCGFQWKWFPIGEIERIAETKSILAAPALSAERIAVKFSDRKILKSSAPLEISPKEKEALIAELLKINPEIQVS